MKRYEIAILPGDGIGPEVVDTAIKVLDVVQKIFGFKLNYHFSEAGNNCIEKHGTNLPKKTINTLKKTNTCLKGPMTTLSDPKAPPSVAVTIRRLFNLYANVRPCKSLPNSHSLKPNIDLVIVRENTEGLYSGVERKTKQGAIAYRIITRKACDRIAKFAFKLAQERRRHLTYAHKANILRLTDGVFNNSVIKISKKYPDVKIDSLHVDIAAANLIKKPELYDVIVTTNLFGDIFSDLAAQIVGGVGLVASANIGNKYTMFEPVHGSAPKYTGQNKVNPIATIFAGKLMLEYLGEKEAAKSIDEAVIKILKEGKIRTYDLGGHSTTEEVGDAIADKINK